jgi:uncharacterized membrane protein YfcA
MSVMPGRLTSTAGFGYSHPVSIELLVLVAVLGFVVGTGSSWLGIGGGIVMAPMLLAVPGWLGLEPLDMTTVAGLTVTQSLASCLTGALTQDRYAHVERRLVVPMGLAIGGFALVGGLGSAWLSARVLLGVFALAALAASVLMVITPRETEGPPRMGAGLAIASGVGAIGGLVGQGGSFLLVPGLLHGVRLSTRKAVGTNLALVVFSSVGGFVGKAVTGQIAGWLAVALVAGAIPGALAGSMVSMKTPPATLRRVLAVLIGLMALALMAQALIPISR